MMPAQKRRVLILGRGDRAFLTVIRSLGRMGLEVHVGMCHPHDIALRSRFVHAVHDVPAYRRGDDSWLDAMTRLLSDRRFDLVVPCNDHAVIPLQVHQAQLRTLAKLATLDDRAFAIAFDKIETYRLADSIGVRQARGNVVPTDLPITAALAGLTLPVVLKPPSSFAVDDPSSRRSVRRARNLHEAGSLLDRSRSWGRVLIQEQFNGVGTGIEVLARNGTILTALQHERVHEPPEGGGSSYRKTTPLHDGMLADTRRLIEAMAYTGVAMVEYKYDRSRDDWSLIEINGRFWGSLPLAVSAGLDFPAFLYQMLVDERTTFPRSYRVGMHCRHLSSDFYWLLANARASKQDPSLATRRLTEILAEPFNVVTGHERWDTFALDDLRPGFADLGAFATQLTAKARRSIERRIESTPWARRRTARRIVARTRVAKRILFVCKGNICRSPFAELYARECAPAGIQLSSSGSYRTPNRPSPEVGISVAREHGINLMEHRSRVLDSGQVHEADLMLTFDRQNFDEVRSAYPQLRDRVFPLGVLGDGPGLDIADPFGGDAEKFRHVCAAIVVAVTRLCAALSTCM
jgi:protein-tyrosine-phosphatase/predicted ATP-grasp superfamily ATP-dependent carboligase